MIEFNLRCCITIDRTVTLFTSDQYLPIIHFIKGSLKSLLHTYR